MQIRKEILDKKRQDYLKQLSDFADWGFWPAEQRLLCSWGTDFLMTLTSFYKEELKEKTLKCKSFDF